MKDNFSLNSDQYALYRPTYPTEFFSYLNTIIPMKKNAWDCGTGNGQVAVELAKIFENVFATDISRSQIDNAHQAGNIRYSVQPAEKTDFNDHQFDLIVVAQAIHWFDFEKFYTEVRRTAKKGALICVIGYGRIIVSEKIDALITNFYKNVVGPFWDKERRYIDEDYETIPFPFDELQAPAFENKFSWSFGHLIGYINTWSAVKHFIKEKGYNPVAGLQDQLSQEWRESETREVKFPLLLRMGKV
jgi:hypothetical protein